MGCFGRTGHLTVPFVVKDVRNKRNLIECRSFEQLVAECRRLYKISNDCEVCVYDEDASEIDDSDCLLALQPYTVLSILRTGEQQIFTPSPLMNAVAELGAALTIDSRRLISTAREVAPALARVLVASQTPKRDSESTGGEASDDQREKTGKRALLDLRLEDPEWFETVRVPKAKSKKAVLRDSAKRRVKGYYYKTKEDLLKTVPRPTVDYMFNELVKRLRHADYNGTYFERGHNEALCCDQGWFCCQGAFDKASCSYIHRINPYAAPEDYLLFSTWNLDHQVERSRSVIPSLREALLTRPDAVNMSYFYNLLFTRSNLRLVHVVCHLKTAHAGLECDPNFVFLPDEDHHPDDELNEKNIKEARVSTTRQIKTNLNEKRGGSSCIRIGAT